MGPIEEKEYWIVTNHLSCVVSKSAILKAKRAFGSFLPGDIKKQKAGCYSLYSVCTTENLCFEGSFPLHIEHVYRLLQIVIDHLFLIRLHHPKM